MLVGLGVESDVTERVSHTLVGLTELGHVTRASIRASVLLIRDLATVHERYQDQPPSTKETQVTRKTHALFHHQISTLPENVKFRAETVVLFAQK